MKPIPSYNVSQEDFLFDEDSRELLEGMEGASVQEKLVDQDFFNRFEDDFDEDDITLPK